MKKLEIIIMVLIFLSFLSGIYFYNQMPEQMASHWNSHGEVDNYVSRFWGLFLMPVVSSAIFLIFMAIPKIDPLKSNIKKFREYYDGFVLLLIVFLIYIYTLTLLWNLGYDFNMSRMIIPAIGLILFYAGILSENAKMNWFVGIRTPWTLSSEKVWEKTNKLGGKLFKIAGVLAFLGVFFPKHAVWLIIIPVLALVAFIFAYSYFEYRKT